MLLPLGPNPQEGKGDGNPRKDVGRQDRRGLVPCVLSGMVGGKGLPGYPTPKWRSHSRRGRTGQVQEEKDVRKTHITHMAP